MNNNLSYFSKIKLFLLFKKTIKNNSSELLSNFNIRIDNSYRMYTVINIPEELIGEAYSIKKSDIDKISENYIREYSSKLGFFLNKIGVAEMFEFYEIRKVDKYSYLIIIGYSLFRSNEFYDMLYWKLIPITSIMVVISFLYFKLFL
jgi:hypothetical protein